MRQSVQQLAEFYTSPLGLACRRIISSKIGEVWGDAAGLDVLALGYATPFLEAVNKRARRVVAIMPAAQGVQVWPDRSPNRSALAAESGLPLPGALFDRILAAHALEESDDLPGALQEITRVLAPSGRVILAVTARHGLWAGSESTPFGQGRPFSRAQLEERVREAGLEPAGWTRALYLPPAAWAAPWAEAFEQVGARLWPPFAGVTLMEAAKHSFAVRPTGYGARQRIRARPSFQPAPIGGKIAKAFFPASLVGSALLSVHGDSPT